MKNKLINVDAELVNLNMHQEQMHGIFVSYMSMRTSYVGKCDSA